MGEGKISERTTTLNVRLYFLQRATAMLMAPLIVGHIALIFYATRKGLSAPDILGRTQGSVGWALYYGVFVMAATIHGAIGLRSIAREWGPRTLAQKPRVLDFLMWAFGVTLAILGLRAVAAVVL